MVTPITELLATFIAKTSAFTPQRLNFIIAPDVAESFLQLQHYVTHNRFVPSLGQTVVYTNGEFRLEILSATEADSSYASSQFVSMGKSNLVSMN